MSGKPTTPTRPPSAQRSYDGATSDQPRVLAMSKAKWSWLWLCIVLPPIATAAEDIAVQHAEPLLDYRIVAAGNVATDASSSSRDRAPLVARFNAFNRDFELALEPNARLGVLQSRLRGPSAAAAYRGRVTGRSRSWVRLVLSQHGPIGLVFDGETLYGIESGADGALAATGVAGTAMFRLADVYVEPGALSCGTTMATDGARAYGAILSELSVLAARGATLNLDLAAVADFEFANTYGAATEVELLARFNNVDGIFSEHVGVQITVADVDIFTTSADPFTTSNANDLLDELAVYRGATPTREAFGLTHLFTGRNLDGATAGVAFLGTVCAKRTQSNPRSFGAGLSEGRRGATLDSLIAAHEIGHNFGAPHDAEAGSACESTPATFLMAPAVASSDDFSPCSIAQMQPEIGSATCLTPIGEPNVSVTTDDPSLEVLAGASFDYVLDVANSGIEVATNVVLAASIDAGLGVTSATATAGSCTIAGGDVTCTLGTLGGGSSQPVTLQLAPTAVGRFAVVASVDANENVDAADDTLTASVTVAPVVDLVVTGNGASLQPSAQTTLAANVVNAADYAATAVTLTATLSSGLRADQAAAGGSACTVAGQVVTCGPRALAPRAMLPFTLTLTGVASGAQQVALAVTAAEAERAAADNQLTLAVSVGAPAPSGGGGGGAASWWLVGTLLGALLGRRGRLRHTLSP